MQKHAVTQDCVVLTCRSVESLTPPSRRAADDPPAASVHCEAAAVELTARWTHHADHLETNIHAACDSEFSFPTPFELLHDFKGESN